MIRNITTNYILYNIFNYYMGDSPSKYDKKQY
jgi:hypothetical protein